MEELEEKKIRIKKSNNKMGSWEQRDLGWTTQQDNSIRDLRVTSKL